MDTTHAGFTNKATHDFFRANERELDTLAASVRITSHSRFAPEVANFCKLLRARFPKASKKIDWWQVAGVALEG